MYSNSSPLVSIIVPLYNQAAFVAETIASINAQTYTNWECVVVDDGSTDGSLAVVKQLASNDSRFILLSQANKGVAAARNKGVKASTGVYLVCLDGDDLISDNYLEECVKYFASNADVKVVVPTGKWIGERTGTMPIPTFSLQILAKQCPFYVSAMFSRLGYDNTTGFDETMLAGLEDWEFWIQLLKNGGSVAPIATAEFYYRIKKQSRNNSFSSKERLAIYNYISTKHAQFFAEHLGGSLLYYKLYKDAAAKVEMIEKWLPKKWLSKLRKWFR